MHPQRRRTCELLPFRQRPGRELRGDPSQKSEGRADDRAITQRRAELHTESVCAGAHTVGRLARGCGTRD